MRVTATAVVLAVSLLLVTLATACDREPQGPEPDPSLLAASGTYSPLPELAYVGHGYDRYVTVVEVPEMREVARIYTGATTGAGNIAIAPDGQFAYITQSDPAGLNKVDLATNTVTEKLLITSGAGAFDIALTPDGRRAFVTQFNGKSVAAIDTREMKLLDEISLTDEDDWVNGIAMDPGGQTVFVASQGSGRVHVIDVKSLAVVGMVETGTSGVNELALTQDGRFILATSGSADRVFAIDPKNMTIAATIDVADYPTSVAIPRDGREAYVTNRAANVVTVIDTRTLEVLAEIPVPPGPGRIAVNTTGQLAIVAHYSNGEITLLDLAERELVTTVYGEQLPWNRAWGIAFATGAARNSGGGRPGVPAHLYVAGGEHQSGIVGRPTFDPFKVYVRDVNYNPMPGAEVSWQVTGGGGLLYETTTYTDDDGVAYAHLLLGEAPGSNTVTASVLDVDPVTFTASGEAGTGALGFIRHSSATGWWEAYDLGLQGRSAWQDTRLPALVEDVWHGYATLRQPGTLSEGRWRLNIDMFNLQPSTEYSIVLARYGLDVNGALDAEDVLDDGWVSEPDELVLLGGSPGGYPDDPCDASIWVDVLANANPFVVGYIVTDGDGVVQIRCKLVANGQWWANSSEYVPPEVQDSIPFIPNTTVTSAGRFELPSYNYVYVVEGRWTPPDPVPDDRIVMRWQMGIDLDPTTAMPIPNGYAPFPIWPKYWP